MIRFCYILFIQKNGTEGEREETERVSRESIEGWGEGECRGERRNGRGREGDGEEEREEGGSGREGRERKRGREGEGKEVEATEDTFIHARSNSSMSVFVACIA